jgi:hypothetical protein
LFDIQSYFSQVDRLIKTGNSDMGRLVVLTLFMLLAIGCGKTMQKAGGKVSVDGVPVKDGAVTFYPIGGGRTASASILPDGTFTLSYEKLDDGLPPGDYKVTIVADIWDESPAAKKQAEAMREAAAKMGAIEDSSITPGGRLINVVPPGYNVLETTPITEKVVLGDKPLVFNYDIPSKKKK